MNIVIDDGHRHPELLAGKQRLLGRILARIKGQLDHPQPSAEGVRVDVPAKVGLLIMGFGDLLHQLEGSLMEFQWELEGLGNGLVGDVIVSPAC